MPRANALLKLFGRGASVASDAACTSVRPERRDTTQSKGDAARRTAAPSKANVRRTPMRIEEIEPRILHSADFAPVLVGDGQVQMRVIDVPVTSPAQPVETQLSTRHEIVFVDMATPDYQKLIDDVVAQAGDAREVEVVLIDGGSDGIKQISDALSTLHDIDAVHIISHGRDATVRLGASALDANSLEARSAEIAGWSRALSQDADVLIYGCDVAASAQGRMLADRLAQLTGADVAASEDVTGSAAQGGDWLLEYHSGAIESGLALGAAFQASWDGVLGSAPVLSGANNLTSINEDPSTNNGTLVSDLIAGKVTDADPGALSGIAVTAVVNTNGAWQYTTNGGSLWVAFGTPSAGGARLLAADASTFVRFVPNANWNGTVTNGLTFHAWDQTIGTNGGLASTIANPVMRDNFGSVSYTNNDGTATWSAGWVDGDGDPLGGRIRITGGQLEIRANNIESIYREANLLGATSATLSFTFTSEFIPTDAGVIRLYASSNGGSSYTTLANFSGVSNLGFGTFSIDISSYIAANTRIKLETVTTDGSRSLFIDNFQIAGVAVGSGGSSAISAASASSSVTVNSVNDAPAGAPHTVTTLEDTAYVFSASDFGFTDTVDSNALLAVKITTLPATGSLTLSGGAVTTGQSISVANINAGNLRFTPAANSNGAANASFTFQVQDDGGIANGGVDLDATPRTMTINVTAVNDAPRGTNISVFSIEDLQDDPFTSDLFGFTDTADTPANNLLAVTITTLPTAGTMKLNGVALIAGQSITVGEIDAGHLTFTAAPNANGNNYATFTFQVQDDGGTANGGVSLDTVARTMTIGVISVNDAPVGTNNTVTVLEDAAFPFSAGSFGFTDPSDSPANTFNGVRITTLPIAGSLTLNGVAVIAGQIITAANVTAGNLVFTPAGNANGAGYTSFTFQVRDSGGTGNGGVNLDTVPRTMTVNVTSVNDAPIGTNNTVTTNEDTAFVFTTAAFGFTDPSDGVANSLLGVKISTLPGAGSLTLSGVAVISGQTISVANINAGNLRFNPAANANGAGYASFTFQVQDDGLTANSGVDLDATARTMAINVTSANDEPAGANNTIAVLEDTTTSLTAAMFGFTDAADSPANSLIAVRITSLATAGTLALSGVTVTTGQSISVADISAGNLTFRAAANANGNAYASFTFQVQDGGGTANSGVDLDASPNTMTINVTAVNDAPAGTDTTVTANEDIAFVFSAASFGLTDAADAGAHGLAAVKITTLPVAGALTLSGAAVTAGDTILLADITAGNLRFASAASASGAGYASFTFQVQDGGGTANGGVDLDASANTLTINVNSVNDAPTGAGTTIGVLENSTFVFSTAVFGFADASDTSANNLLAVKITTLPLAGSLKLNGVAVTAGQVVSALDIAANRLVFTPAPSTNGVGYASFTFQVQDDGGTANGGVDLDTVARTLTIDVGPINHAPRGYTSTVITLEDTPYTLSAASFGFTDPNDSPANTLAGVKIVALPAAGTLTVDGTAVSAGDVVSVADIVANKLVFTPGANANGVAYASFTFRVQDDGGVANGGVDLDPTPNTLTFDVTSVNDAPIGANATVATNEDTAIVLGAASFGFTDPADTAANTLLAVKIASLPVAGSLTVNGVAVIAGQFVSAADIAAGRLVFTPALNANGAGYATLTFQVQDDGGVANAGADLDVIVRTLTINVASVNDAPAGADNTVLASEDTPFVFGAAAFGFSDASDPSANHLLAVRIDALPASGALTLNGVAVTAGQLVSAADIAAGRLVFASAHDANGAAYASFAFRVQDDGGTSNGGVDFDATARTMTIDVAAVNDAPTGASTTLVTLEDTALVLTTADFGFGDAADAPANRLLAIRIATAPGAGELALSGTTVVAGQYITAADIAAGNLVFRPATDANGNGYASFTFQVQDDGGGSDLAAAARAITIDVTPVADYVPPPMMIVEIAPPVRETIEIRPSTTSSISTSSTASISTSSSTSASTSTSTSASASSSTPATSSVAAAAKADSEKAATETAAATATAEGKVGGNVPGGIGATGGDTPVIAVAVQVGVQRLDSQQAVRDTRNVVALVMADAAAVVQVQAESSQVAMIFGGPQAQNVAGTGTSAASAAAAAEHRALLTQMDEMRDTLREQPAFEASSVAASAAASIGLSVGYVVWLLRGGVLLSTVLYSLPAWRSLDPLPVLERTGADGESDDDDEDHADDSIESLVARNNAADDAAKSPVSESPEPSEAAEAPKP